MKEAIKAPGAFQVDPATAKAMTDLSYQVSVKISELQTRVA
jgi:hypothetical protein